ncbi:hypothetical protein GQ651_08300 [Alphaproteobacteria bacterium GH1-50]|uniref:Major facilitator superfamily (MFS) profile domain-containing protein n=1 Tax=Kangsaoukella pontilimi TaxID=2691042 RepID=A0A7C9IRR8_9RHOB|nr:hypothetical protein [Kangsaoukella pontilimi]MXQ07846.1 hypothetical protein [Kangsaoukella pontilimi]
MLYSQRLPLAALAILIVLQIVMLSALYAGIPPHPPVATPLFGIAPFIGASVSVALAAMITGPLSGRAGKTLSGVAAVLALVSFGPQKYFDAQIGLIWPAVILGQGAALAVFVSIFRPADDKAAGSPMASYTQAG